MFLVTGITGQIGGAAARALLEGGHSVRALVRDLPKAAEWADRGVELAQGDLTDAATIAAALAGVEGAFILQPTPMGVTPDFPEARALNASIVEALRRACPPRLVVLSSVGSEKHSGLGNITQTHLLEEALADAPCSVAILRAAALIENNLRALERASMTGVFDSFLQPTDQRFPMVATVDVGREAARLLVEEWSGTKVVEVGSPRSPEELALAMGEVLGRPVEARAVPREQWEGILGAMGMPVSKIANLVEMQDGFNSGWTNFGVEGTEASPGTTTPAQVFAEVWQQKGSGDVLSASSPRVVADLAALKPL